MRFAAGIGIFTTVGLLVCGSVSAAQATDEETPQPPSTESALPSASASTDTEDGPSEENSEDPPDTEAMPMNCEQTERDVETVTVQFQEDIPFDEVTVKINGQPAQTLDVGESEVVLDGTEAFGTISINLWDGEELSGECKVTVAEPSPSESEPEPTDPEPTGPGSAEPSDTESTGSEEPPETTSPPPTQTAPVSPTPAPSSPAPSNPQPTRPGPSSPDHATGHPQPAPTSQHPSQNAPPPSQSDAATTQPSTHEPRDIRQFSDNPRYLLPQLFGIDSQHGSRLIMPRPRSTEQQEPDLETLPPVSEEELDAIKARLSSPDRADQPGGEVNNAEIDRRLSQRNTWWVFSGITGLVGLGAALWWATTRRKRKH